MSAVSYWHSTFLFQQSSALSNIRILTTKKEFHAPSTVSILKEKTPLLSLNIPQVLILNKPFCILPSFKNCWFLVRTHSLANVLKLPFPNINRKHVLTNPTQACLIAVWGQALLSHRRAYSAQKFPKYLGPWTMAFNFWFLITTSLDISSFLTLLQVSLVPQSRLSPLLWTLKPYTSYLASDQTVIFLGEQPDLDGAVQTKVLIDTSNRQTL